jgi:hypothetical protein
MVAECRNALTGVGAVIASGSQKWNGNCADLVNAPARTRTSATGYSAWVARSTPARAEIRDAATGSTPRSIAIARNVTNPASNASPPAPVTSSACSADRRAAAERWSNPISRNEQTEVSSQYTNSAIRSSATTSPSIAPRNASSVPCRRPRRASPAR